MRVKFIPMVMVVILLMVNGGVFAETVTTSDDQKTVSLTIYNTDLALVRDTRTIAFPTGEQVLAFKEISSKIMPETALIKADHVSVIEQNFEFDLLTPQTLLNKYVGRIVTLVRENKATGEFMEVPAKVLSTASGIVFQVGSRIETQVAGRLIYPDVPANLRDKPTLTMALDSSQKGARPFELSYLTRGLSWKTDYVAELNSNEDRLDLKAWVTLTNHSGVDYKDAKLQLVAGDVNRARPRELRLMADQVRVKAESAPMERVSEESLLEYHLYTVNRKTTVKNNQSKQIALLQEDNGICTKQLILKHQSPGFYWNRNPRNYEKKSVDVYLNFKNDKASNFGLPKPAGIIRVYKKDQSGFSQFVGEDRISHTPENEWIKMKLGRAFDVTADRRQTHYSFTNASEKHRRIYENEYQIILKNAKPEPVEVRVEEQIPGEWQILSQSHTHVKDDSATIFWNVTVPAKGKTVLRFRVKTKI